MGVEARRNIEAGASGLNDRSRGIAIARPAGSPPGEQSRGSSHPTPAGAIQMSPERSCSSVRDDDRSDRQSSV